MSYSIRKSVKADMSQVLKLIKELAIFEKEPEAVELTEQDLINDGFCKNPKFESIVIESLGEIYGVAIYYYRYSTWKGITIHLEDLIITQNQRGKGLGPALFKEVIKIGHQKNIKRIEWSVLNWNNPAINFYKKAGAVILDDWRTVQMDKLTINKFIKNENF